MVSTRRSAALTSDASSVPCKLVILKDGIISALERLGPSFQFKEGQINESSILWSETRAQLEPLSAFRTALHGLAPTVSEPSRSVSSQRRTRATSSKEAEREAAILQSRGREVLSRICDCPNCSTASVQMTDGTLANLNSLWDQERSLARLEAEVGDWEGRVKGKVEEARDAEQDRAESEPQCVTVNHLPEKDQTLGESNRLEDTQEDFKLHAETCSWFQAPHILGPISAEMQQLVNGRYGRTPKDILDNATAARTSFAALYRAAGLTDEDAEKPLTVYDGLCSCGRQGEVDEAGKTSMVWQLQCLVDPISAAEVERLGVFYGAGEIPCRGEGESEGKETAP